MKKKNSWFIVAANIALPLLIYQAITLVIQNMAMFTIQSAVLAVHHIEEAADTLANSSVVVELMMEYAMTSEAQEKIWAIYYQNAMWISLGSALLGLPIFYMMFRSDAKKRSVSEVKFKKPHAWFLLVVLGISSCICLNDWIVISGIMESFPEIEEVSKLLYGGDIFIELLAIGIALPIVEELIFRGLAYKRICDISSPVYAMSISALLFGLYHMNMVQGIYAYCLGLLLAYVYKHFKTILAPIVFHISANVISVCITELVGIDTTVDISLVWIEVLAATVLTAASFYGLWHLFRKEEAVREV